jgi:hypothetical protein
VWAICECQQQKVIHSGLLLNNLMSATDCTICGISLCSIFNIGRRIETKENNGEILGNEKENEKRKPRKDA